MSTFLTSVIAILTSGFVLSTLLIFLALLVYRHKREQLLDVLESTHWIILGVACLHLLLFIFTLPDVFTETSPDTSVFIRRATGPYWWSYWLMLLLPIIAPQLLWWKKARRSIGVAFFMIFCSYFGRIFEILIIIITSLHRDFLPSSWEPYSPTLAEMLIPITVYAALVASIYFLQKRISKKDPA